MKIYMDGNDTVLTHVEDFNLKETLECGQCFNFVRKDISTDNSFCYRIIAHGKALIAEQDNRSKEDGCILRLYNTDIHEYETIWEHYFDLDTDYKTIKESIIKGSGELQDIIKENSGIRLLNQEYFETLISFIISQNKQIPQIKAVVKNISQMAGKLIKDNGEEVYSFPDALELAKLSEENIRECKAGFRAPYIMDAVRLYLEGSIKESEFIGISTDDARRLLMTVKGVGEKVANCVLLYSLGRREAFPVDVWMKRIMEHLYFKKDTDKKVIEEYAYEKYGEDAGYAQQYLFIYGKNNLMK